MLHISLIRSYFIVHSVTSRSCKMCLLCYIGSAVTVGYATFSLGMLHSAVYTNARDISEVNQQFVWSNMSNERHLYLKFWNKAKRAPHCNVSSVNIRTRAVHNKSTLRLYIWLRRTETVKNERPADNLSNTDRWTFSGYCVVEKEMSDLSSLTMIQLLERQWL